MPPYTLVDPYPSSPILGITYILLCILFGFIFLACDVIIPDGME
jgi:hypothetical protein